MRSKLALVTGASGGIGREIALALSGDDYHVIGVARNISWDGGSPVIGLKADLAEVSAMDSVIEFVKRQEKLDVLVHAAGVFYHGNDLEQLHRQNAVNVQAPYYLSRALSTRLARANGQIIFLNSLAALGGDRPKVQQYAATKRALRSVADELRRQLNPLGIRVTSLFLGQVATEMQKQNYDMEGWNYKPEALMQPQDVALAVLDIVHLPQRAEMTDITLRSTTIAA